MASFILQVGAGLIATYLFLRLLLRSTQNPTEPPALATTIPFLSPMIGMRAKGKFYTRLRDRFNLPIYTLRLPFQRLYIINSTDLIPIAQRHVRILDFAPVEAKVVMNVVGASPEARKILIRDRDGKKDYSYAIEYDKAIHPAVTPGPNLDEMNRNSIVNVAKAVETLSAQGTSSLKLFEWVQKEITVATTDAVYGPHNPFRDRRIREAYCKFEPGIITLLLDLYPSIFARHSLKGREDMVEAFDHYFTSGGHDQASAFVKVQHQHKLTQGITGKDISRFEIAGIVAVLNNTVPASFWVLFHAISDAVVLEECRQEIMACCAIDDHSVTLDISQVKQSCPILLSIFKESLRYHGIGTSVRMVIEDHLLDGKYLLKKGGIVMIPGPVQHSSKAAYGEEVDQFQHKRFVKSPGQKRPNPVAFRGFGGGFALCPGRHFATTEVLAFVALAIARFDFEPVSGNWLAPKTENAGMAGTIAPPDEDVEVRVVPRSQKKWDVILSGSGKGIEISAEDMQ